jgi:hypothetical protein
VAESKFAQAIAKGYATDGPAIELGHAAQAALSNVADKPVKGRL